MRLATSAPIQDYMFVFDRRKGDTLCGGAFGTQINGLRSSSTGFHECQQQFCTENNLAYFSLAQIRATLSDDIALRHGIVVASSVLGHADIRTTERHYVSQGTRWREMEHLGTVLIVMERWWGTKGKVDPRRGVLAPTMDRGAATPGFFCFDPYDSPIVGQEKGRLCKAYGWCPSCPLAAANVRDPFAVALYVSLRKAIQDAHCLIGPETWLDRFAMVLADLEGLLKHVSSEVMDLALRFKVTLPSVE